MTQNMFKHSLIRKSSEANLQIVRENRNRCVSSESCFELDVSSSYRAAGTQPHGGEKAFHSRHPLFHVFN